MGGLQETYHQSCVLRSFKQWEAKEEDWRIDLKLKFECLNSVSDIIQVLTVFILEIKLAIDNIENHRARIKEEIKRNWIQMKKL
jgi:hypothetical protein